MHERNIHQMTKRIMIGAAILASGLLFFCPTHSKATTITFDLQYEISGGTPPAGTPPWLRATFDDDNTPGSVTLTLTALNLTGSEKVTEWDFNFDPSKNLNFLIITQTSGPTADSITKDKNNLKGGGDGYFDIGIYFSPSGPLFTVGSQAVFSLISSEAITANSFNSFSNLKKKGSDLSNIHTVAHVQAIGESANLSGWVADQPPAAVPEPATMFLLGSGLIGLAGFARRRFKR